MFELIRVGFRYFDHLLTIENKIIVNLDNTNRSLNASSSLITRFVASNALLVLGTYVAKPSNHPFFKFNYSLEKY